MPKVFTAQHSDLSGPTNPTGILSPQFLALKQALDRGDAADNVLQALSDWLAQRGKGTTNLEPILDLGPDGALDALIERIGGGLDKNRLPPVALQTLQRAVQRLAGKHVERREREMDAERGRIAGMRASYRLEARQIVDSLLDQK